MDIWTIYLTYLLCNTCTVVPNRGAEELNDTPDELPGTLSCIDDVRLAQEFIEALKHASLDNGDITDNEVDALLNLLRSPWISAKMTTRTSCYASGFQRRSIHPRKHTSTPSTLSKLHTLTTSFFRTTKSRAASVE
jgi:hypothetical protein